MCAITYVPTPGTEAGTVPACSHVVATLGCRRGRSQLAVIQHLNRAGVVMCCARLMFPRAKSPQVIVKLREGNLLRLMATQEYHLN